MYKKKQSKLNSYVKLISERFIQKKALSSLQLKHFLFLYNHFFLFSCQTAWFLLNSKQKNIDLSWTINNYEENFNFWENKDFNLNFQEKNQLKVRLFYRFRKILFPFWSFIGFKKAESLIDFNRDYKTYFLLNQQLSELFLIDRQILEEKKSLSLFFFLKA